MTKTVALSLLASSLFSTAAVAALPADWSLAGSATNGVAADGDPAVQFEGKPTMVIRSLPAFTKGMAALNNHFSADAYRGKRVRYSAMLKTQECNTAALFMTVGEKPTGNPDHPHPMLRADNMRMRASGDAALKGTNDWKRYEIVLDIPQEAYAVTIGFYLSGRGKVWMSDPKVEVVDASVPVTSEDSQMEPKLPAGPALDFGKK